MKYSLKDFLDSVFSNLVKRKADIIIEQMAIHRVGFLKGEKITVPASAVFEKTEFTDELIKTTLSSINHKEELNCHCEINSDNTFITIILKNK